MRLFAVLLVVVLAATTAAILWRPSGRGIFFGCGLICAVGLIAGMVAMHMKRKFDREAEILLAGSAERDV